MITTLAHHKQHRFVAQVTWVPVSLVQSTFSFSREDAENKLLPICNRNGILKDNPFAVLDEKGVDKPMQLTVETAAYQG